MLRELNSRETSYGVSVALIYDDSDNSVWVELETADDWSRFEIRPEEASEAFDHPFVFQARALNSDGRLACLPRGI